MPRPKRPHVCAEDGCPNLVTGAARCPDHERPAFGGARGTRAVENRQDIYNDPRWRGLRRQVRREQLLCDEPGCREVWTELDHVVPVNEGGAPFARENVHGLCKPHHSSKTSREIHARRREFG